MGNVDSDRQAKRGRTQIVLEGEAVQCGASFKTIEQTTGTHKPDGSMSTEDFLACFRTEVQDQFLLLAGLPVMTLPVDLLPGQEPAVIPLPAVCQAQGSPEQCRECWQEHRLALQRKPVAHWHQCKRGNFCGVVPVVVNQSCIMVCRVVCPASGPQENAFRHKVELLRLLVERFLNIHRDSASKFIPEEPDAVTPGRHPALPADKTVRESWHPQVCAAIEHIDRHVGDTSMTVGGIARELGLDSTYLGHLFSEQVGQPMHRYVTERRIELAKKLLATTNWQIKYIAHKCGHGNTNWFSHVFKTETGLTPTKYRRQALARQP